MHNIKVVHCILLYCYHRRDLVNSVPLDVCVWRVGHVCGEGRRVVGRKKRVELLCDGKSKCGEHRDAGVLQLDLAQDKRTLPSVCVQEARGERHHGMLIVANLSHGIDTNRPKPM